MSATRDMRRAHVSRPLLVLPIVGGLAAYAPGAGAVESTSAIRFEDRSYTYVQVTQGIPRCPALLETLYSMETMRELTDFVDGIAMVKEEPGFQIVRIGFSLLGIRGSLTYERTCDAAANVVTIELVSYETAFRSVPHPTSFLARYRVVHEGDGTRVTYTQRATTSKDVSVFYRMFVKRQMGRFDRKLRRVIERTCR